MKLAVACTAVLALLACASPASAASSSQRQKLVTARVKVECLKVPRCNPRSVRVFFEWAIIGFTPADTNYDYGYSFSAGVRNCYGGVRYMDRFARPDGVMLKSKPLCVRR